MTYTPNPGAAQWNGARTPSIAGLDGNMMPVNVAPANVGAGLAALQGQVSQWPAPPTVAQTNAALSSTSIAPQYIPQVATPTSPYQQALAARAYNTTGPSASFPPGGFAQNADTRLDPRTTEYLKRCGISSLAYDPEGVKDRLRTWAMLTPEEGSRLSPEMCVAAYTYMMIAEGRMPAPSDLTPQGQALKTLVSMAERQDPMLTLRLKQSIEMAYAPKTNNQTQQNGQQQSMLSGTMAGSVFV